MAEFRPNQPVTTREPTVEVSNVVDGHSLPVGRHRFRLIVVDETGRESAPDEIEVVVLDDERPTAVLEGPETVKVGESFVLSGKKSSDPEGAIVQYRWTLVSSPTSKG